MHHSSIAPRSAPTSAHTTRDSRSASSWQPLLAPYVKPDARRGIIQLLNTFPPFLAIMAAILWGLDHGIMAALLLSPVGAGLLVRLFAIQHDCGHNSFFPVRWVNDLLGRLLGVVTFTPYTFWRRNHAVHHATSGNLDGRGIGDVATATVREYLAMPAGRRLAYWLYRHPLVIFGLGPLYLVLIRHRIPTGQAFRQRRSWLSIFGTNAAIVAVIAPVALTIGLKPVLLGYLPVLLLAAFIGVWLFYVQHQFEDGYWRVRPGWQFHAAAMQGSSFFDLPRSLHWITGNIGFHHIHHLSSRIPNYRLRACHAENAELRDAKRLTLLGSVRCARFALWDEERGRMVRFKDIK